MASTSEIAALSLKIDKLYELHQKHENVVASIRDALKEVKNKIDEIAQEVESIKAEQTRQSGMIRIAAEQATACRHAIGIF
ncbi:Hypothetical protein D9617_18g033850 [Elsinoe fawcettii]|nr:Hypothetical protein D9617_18g033850 [Elsinoe fawcettii]